jgi:hypothetical protein
MALRASTLSTLEEAKAPDLAEALRKQNFHSLIKSFAPALYKSGMTKRLRLWENCTGTRKGGVCLYNRKGKDM